MVARPPSAVCVAISAGLALLAGCDSFRSEQPKVAPSQDVAMDPETLRGFQNEILEYVEMRRVVLQRIPEVTAKATPEEIAARREELAEEIRTERRNEKEGSIFQPAVATALRSILKKELAGRDDAARREVVRTGNPKVEGTPRRKDPTHEVKRSVTVAVNASYPEEAPVSSVPASLLLRLPPLPDPVQYGFVGRTLILRDAEAELILDFIPDAVPDATLPR